jgi:Xaa-Pro aminopeptidase
MADELRFARLRQARDIVAQAQAAAIAAVRPGAEVLAPISAHLGAS